MAETMSDVGDLRINLTTGEEVVYHAELPKVIVITSEPDKRVEVDLNEEME